MRSIELWLADAAIRIRRPGAVMTRRESANRRGRWRAAYLSLYLVALVGGVAALAYAALGSSDNPGFRGSYLPPPPGTPGHAATLDELFTQPDLIVVGVVESNDVGRTVGVELPVQFSQTRLRIESAIAGSPPTTVLIEAETEGVPFEREWREPGTRVLAFLWLKRDDVSGGRFYRLISQDGAFVVRAGALEPANRTALSAQVEALGLEAAASAVRSARQP